MAQFKDVEVGSLVYFWFAANATTGAAGDGATPLYDVRLAGAAAGAIPTASGTPTLLTHANYTDGLYEIAIDTTGYAAGEYAVFCTLTISTVNPAGFSGSFRVVAVGDSLHSAAARVMDAIPNATAGAAGGLLIAGSNAATTFATLTVTGVFAVSDGVVITCSTVSKTGLEITGGATAGLGINITGIGGADALRITGPVGGSSITLSGGFSVGGSFQINNALDVGGATTFNGAITAAAANDIRGVKIGGILATALPVESVAGRDAAALGKLLDVATPLLDCSAAMRGTDSAALASVWTSGRGDKIDNLDAAVSTRSTYAGADTAGTTTLLVRCAEARLAELDAANLPADVAAIPTTKTGYSLAATGLDAVMIETGMNARQAMAIIASALAGILSGAATSTIIIKAAQEGTTTRISATCDADGNRSAITLTLPS